MERSLSIAMRELGGSAGSRKPQMGDAAIAARRRRRLAARSRDAVIGDTPEDVQGCGVRGAGDVAAWRIGRQRYGAKGEPTGDRAEHFIELLEREPLRNRRVDDPGSDRRIERVEVDMQV